MHNENLITLHTWCIVLSWATLREGLTGRQRTGILQWPLQSCGDNNTVQHYDYTEYVLGYRRQLDVVQMFSWVKTAHEGASQVQRFKTVSNHFTLLDLVSICIMLFVLQQDYTNYWTDFHETWWEGVSGVREEVVRFWCRSRLWFSDTFTNALLSSALV